MRKMVALALLLVLFALSGCLARVDSKAPSGGDTMQGKQIKFGGANGFELVGTLWKNDSSTKPALILVHQLGRDRHSFDAFAAFAFKNGFTVLSFDLRGHGESRPGNVSYLNFSPSDWQLVAKDIQAARNELNAEKVLVVGASIGANAALNYSVGEASCAGMVALSPGLDYRGLTTAAAAQSTKCPMLIVASKEDQYAAQSSQTLFSSASILYKKLLLIEDAGHGTDMYGRRAALQQEVLDWLDAHAGN